MRAPEAGGQSATDANAEAPLTPEYCAAMEAHNAAMREYRRITELHRAGKLNSDAWRAARRARDEAHANLERAYNAAIAERR